MHSPLHCRLRLKKTKCLLSVNDLGNSRLVKKLGEIFGGDFCGGEKKGLNRLQKKNQIEPPQLVFWKKNTVEPAQPDCGKHITLKRL